MIKDLGRAAPHAVIICPAVAADGCSIASLTAANKLFSIAADLSRCCGEPGPPNKELANSCDSIGFVCRSYGAN